MTAFPREKFLAIQLRIYTENARLICPRKHLPQNTLVLFVLIHEIKIDLNDKRETRNF